jgi:hypothetical protein
LLKEPVSRIARWGVRGAGFLFFYTFLNCLVICQDGPKVTQLARATDA